MHHIGDKNHIPSCLIYIIFHIGNTRTLLLIWHLWLVKEHLRRIFLLSKIYFSQKIKIILLNIELKLGNDSHVPVHIRRPSPRQVRHFVVASFVLIFPSLEGSSHRFSPRRKTRCSNTSTFVTPSLTTFC